MGARQSVTQQQGGGGVHLRSDHHSAANNGIESSHRHRRTGLQSAPSAIDGTAPSDLTANDSSYGSVAPLASVFTGFIRHNSHRNGDCPPQPSYSGHVIGSSISQRNRSLSVPAQNNADSIELGQEDGAVTYSSESSDEDGVESTILTAEQPSSSTSIGAERTFIRRMDPSSQDHHTPSHSHEGVATAGVSDARSRRRRHHANRGVSVGAAGSGQSLRGLRLRLANTAINVGSSLGGVRRSLPLFALFDIKCPVCNKVVPSDDAEVHLVMCLTRPKITYNEDILEEEKGECAICFDEMSPGTVVARLPCLCLYHKTCIDSWFTVRNSCPEHPSD